VVQVGGEPREVLPPGVLDRMTDMMAHRGPSDRGTFVTDGVALGVRRLSIVDVEGGHQPFSNEDGSVWAIQNGELYNHEDVRHGLTLSGHAFASRCDTEVLPHLYEQAGAGFPKQLRGMFAIAVWDGRRRRAVLARDRLGIKPLYYARSGDLVVFASELKSLLASGLVGGKLDYEAIDAYLTLGFFPGPRTPLREVSKLMPGCTLSIDPQDVRVERYWRYPAPSAAPAQVSLEETAERLLHELDESVRLRLMSDVPLGAMLSGGLDSSLIVALMARRLGEPVKTFSVGFAEAGRDNELADARLVAERYGTDHHELALSFSQLPVGLEQLVWTLDEPLASLSALGFLELSRLAARHVTVALSGQGADELLGGYRKHLAASLIGRLDARLPGLAGGLRRGARLGPLAAGRAARALAAADPVERLLASSGRLAPGLRGRLVRGPLAALDGSSAERALRLRLDGVGNDPLRGALFLDAQLGLVDDMLHYFDRSSMAHSLEVRVPFLDHHLVELCATIPSAYKVRGLTRKAVLKRAARGIVPDRIIDKRKIGFFHTTIDPWLRAQVQGAISQRLLEPDPACGAILDAGAVRQLAQRHLSGRDTSHGQLLLAILMLELWLSSYLPRALGPAEPSGSLQPSLTP
jgi:asparagine synthase (glutamine-hydrolysing)